LELKIINKLSELDRVAEFLEDFGERNGIPGTVIFEINLSIDELVTNTINYGFQDDNEHFISILPEKKGNIVSVELKDDGIEFNPFAKPDPDITLPLEEKPIGGLGIYFVKLKMDDWAYTRKDNLNIIQLKKSFN